MLYDLPILSIDQVIEHIDAVGRSDLETIASELFNPQRLSLAGVGPAAEAFTAAIAPLARAATEAAPL